MVSLHGILTRPLRTLAASDDLRALLRLAIYAALATAAVAWGALMYLMVRWLVTL